MCELLKQKSAREHHCNSQGQTMGRVQLNFLQVVSSNGKISGHKPRDLGSSIIPAAELCQDLSFIMLKI